MASVTEGCKYHRKHFNIENVVFSQQMEKSFLQQEMNDHDYDEGHSKELACKVLTNDALYWKVQKMHNFINLYDNII